MYADPSETRLLYTETLANNSLYKKASAIEIIFSK